MRSRPVKRIADVRTLRAANSPRTPARSPIRCGRRAYREINNFYTATVYEKGAEVVRMLKTLLGAERSAAAWISISSATTARRRRSRTSSRCFADAASVGSSAVHALVRSGRHAGTRRRDATMTPRRARSRSISPSTSPPTPGQPVKIADGRAARRRACRRRWRGSAARPDRWPHADARRPHAHETVGDFRVHGHCLRVRPFRSIADFSAPVNITADSTEGELRFLAARDRDPFNRWQAVQTIASALLIENVASRAQASGIAARSRFDRRARRHSRRRARSSRHSSRRRCRCLRKPISPAI